MYVNTVSNLSTLIVFASCYVNTAWKVINQVLWIHFTLVIKTYSSELHSQVTHEILLKIIVRILFRLLRILISAKGHKFCNFWRLCWCQYCRISSKNSLFTEVSSEKALKFQLMCVLVRATIKRLSQSLNHLLVYSKGQ